MRNFVKNFRNFIFLQVLVISSVSGDTRKLYLTGIPHDSNDQPSACDNSKCGPGEMCELRSFQVMCFRAPCPQPDPIPTCVRPIYPIPEEEVELDGQGSEPQQEEGTTQPPQQEEEQQEPTESGHEACDDDQNPDHEEVQSGQQPGEELDPTQQPGEETGESVQPSEQVEDFTHQPEEPVEPGEEADHFPEEEHESLSDQGATSQLEEEGGEEPGSQSGYYPTIPPLFEPGSGWEDGHHSGPPSRRFDQFDQ